VTSGRALTRGAALALSVIALVGLRRSTTTAVPALGMSAPAQPTEVTAPRDRQPAHQPGHWSVVVDGWHIELDQVAAQHALARDPEIAAEPAVPSLLSPYDQLIGRYADEVGLDWRFVAAVIYEESRFQPDSVSEAGAYGLMQVRPAAAREVGEVSFREPEANIRAGVHYLQRLEREYAGARDRDRHALMLAAYNMGMAHVQDAQALAGRFGYDPLRWDGAMDVMVSLLEEPRVYERLSAGFAQGRGVVDYVDHVLRRYAMYRQQLPPAPPGGAPSRAIAAR
jgi:soluble lytic murein transglycosylase-like protein